ncbi:MAG: hypothetical protein V3V99_10070 [candidate division Zixibacteria bacterium]
MSDETKQVVRPGGAKRGYDAWLKKAGQSNIIEKIIDKRPSVFNKRGREQMALIDERLGWTDVMRSMKRETLAIERMADTVREDGLEHLFVLGMGGSSLSADVFSKVFGKQSWLKSFTIVDTTAPTVLDELFKAVELTKSFFIVESKSGNTIETISLFRLLFRRIKDVRPLKAGKYFCAVTDERSDLHHMSRRNRFRALYLNPEDVGGRYSALSYFGLVPAAFTKANLNGILSSADDFLSTMESNPNDNDALSLGCLLGSAWESGKDKLRFIASKKTSSFIPWIEQLVAESTGKEGKGILPIEGDNRGPASDVNNDSTFIYYSMGSEKPSSLPSSSSNIPRAIINVSKSVNLGAEMLKWEMATAVGSIIMGVNPFDEPNVAETKANTLEFLKTRRGPRKVIPIDPIFHYGDMDIVHAEGIKSLARKKPYSPEEIIRSFLGDIEKGDYISLLCYSEITPAIERKLNAARDALAQNYKVTVSRSFGPRYLHSLGQLHKGGKQNGHFIVFEREYSNDYNIPLTLFSFERLIKAQAKGDIATLKKRKRPVITINLKHNPAAGLNRFLELIKK